VRLQFKLLHMLGTSKSPSSFLSGEHSLISVQPRCLASGRRSNVASRMILGPRTQLGLMEYHCCPMPVWGGSLELVQLVYRHSADRGATLALQYAVGRSNYEIARWLLENAKPDVNSKNFQGKTPLSVARERRMRKLFRF
jgi:hypothetical protein